LGGQEGKQQLKLPITCGGVRGRKSGLRRGTDFAVLSSTLQGRLRKHARTDGWGKLLLAGPSQRAESLELLGSKGGPGRKSMMEERIGGEQRAIRRMWGEIPKDEQEGGKATFSQKTTGHQLCREVSHRRRKKIWEKWEKGFKESRVIRKKKGKLKTDDGGPSATIFASHQTEGFERFNKGPS